MRSLIHSVTARWSTAHRFHLCRPRTFSISAAMAQGDSISGTHAAKRVKVTGRAFYESIGSPKMIVAPMVDRSEFAWRMLTRSYVPDGKKILAYSPMYHARLFKDQARFRDAHFQPTKESLTSKDKSGTPTYLDGREDIDRPLFVQFCANKPEEFLEAAQYVQHYCDAVDLNLGCPQGIARSGNYGAFLQEDWDTIHKMIRKLRDELEVPVTAKFRILESKEKTLEYATMLLDAGASILTVHGRERHQKGHNTGVADWRTIRYLKENLPPDTVLFANGNVLNSEDLQPCLHQTGADGVMSAEGNLSDPTIFAVPSEDPREYWKDGERGGYRIDAVFRRYLDIIWRYVLEKEPPVRRPLYVVGEKEEVVENSTCDQGEKATTTTANENASHDPPATTAHLKRANEDGEELTDIKLMSKKQKKKHGKDKNMAAVHNPNLKSMQGHLFQLLRPMVNSHIPIRDALARSRAGDMAAFEVVLSMVEEAVKKGLQEGWKEDGAKCELTGSEIARERCRRPFWVCQPHIRPLPDEAIKIGAMTMSKKEQKKVEAKSQAGVAAGVQEKGEEIVSGKAMPVKVGLEEETTSELPREEALACG